MAVDPQISQALGTIAKVFLPLIIFAAVIRAIGDGLQKPKRRRRNADKDWFDRFMDGRDRSRMFNESRSLQQLRQLSPDQFEQYIVELFRKLGYNTHHVGGSYDGGIDVIAEKDGVKHLIQCKKFITSQVPVSAVRDFYGAIVDHINNDKAFFITTNVFTLDAENFCEDKPIELIDGKKLMEYIRQAGVVVPDAHSASICPKCGGILKQRTGKYGPFIGCSNYPKCTYTKST